MTEILQLPESGPLTAHRRNASFDWKQLSLYVHGEEQLHYMVGMGCIHSELNQIHVELS